MKLLRIEPYTRRLMAAFFSNGRIVFFAKKDLDFKLLKDLEEVERRLEVELKAPNGSGGLPMV